MPVTHIYALIYVKIVPPNVNRNKSDWADGPF